jgi:uncharacterized BrkB/YihY/UPF0761 family membrane protein
MFNGHAVTSTIYDKPSRHSHQTKFNYWIIIMTGTIFFITLSWYNVFLVLYNYCLGIPPSNGETPNQQLLSVIGYAVIWTLLVIALYFVLKNKDLLTENINFNPHDATKIMSRYDLLGVK